MKKYILIIVVISSLTSSLHSQWIKQNWPVFESVYGVSFFNANTGLVAGKTFPENYQILYRSTNSGYNWSICIWPFRISLLQKIDSITALFCASNREPYGGNSIFFWTTNKGVNWDSVNYGYTAHMGMYFLTRDTGWTAIFDGDFMRYYFTSNGGISFVLLYSHFSSSYQPKMFFLREKYNGNYIGYRSESSAIKKTTNGGYNWMDLPALPVVPEYDKNDKLLTPPDVTQITFINKDTGWVTNGTQNIFKTTNGGYNWIVQNLKIASNISVTAYNFKVLNTDIIYSDAAEIHLPNNRVFGIVFKTTNGGLNWGYQLPDTTTLPLYGYLNPEFLNNDTGWFVNLHTTNGGGPITFTTVKNNSVENPGKYNLYQNYPNPFNPSTTIDFYLPRSSEVYLRIFDITGRLVYKVIEGFRLEQGLHSYRIEGFSSLGLSSGIYFYRLTANDTHGKTVYKETKKMIFNK
jgi:hypothetical protein